MTSKNTNDDDDLTKARALLQKGQKIFLQPSHPPGFLHEKAQWQGEYHLAYVQEGYNSTTHQFRALWKRNGHAVTVTHTLHSPKQVMMLDDVEKLDGMTVQIEDDDNGNVHTARIIDICDNRPGEVRIKWNRGDEQFVNLSQVSVGYCNRRRKRQRRQRATAEEDGKRNKKNGQGRKKKNEEEDIEVISIASSSSSEEEEEEQSERKRPPWNTAMAADCDENQERAHSSSSVKSKASSRKKVTGESNGGNVVEGLEKGTEEEANCITAQQDNSTTISASGELSISEDDLRSYMVNYERDSAALLAADKENSQEGSSLPTTASSRRSEESSSAAAGQTMLPTQGSTSTSLLSDENGASTCKQSVQESTASSVCSEEMVTQERATRSLPSSDASSEVDAIRQRASSTRARKRVTRETKRASSPPKRMIQESSTSSSASDESEVDTRKRASGTRARKRVTRDTQTASSPSEGKMAARKRRVTPHKKNSSTSSLPSDDNHKVTTAASSSPKGNNGILMHGFCRSIPQMKDDPYQTIELVQNMLDKARECEKDSEEFRETLVDANMLLQEILFNLNERTTTFVKAPCDKAKSSSSPKSDGNKSLIVRIAKRFGLTQEQIDYLFTRLDDVNDGYYSIDDAIPKIMETKNANNNTLEEESDEEEDDSNPPCAVADDDDGEQEKQLELLGSRVRTVLEDGREYEGTISTVHYRVTYDDGDTETLVSDAEAFENLACNDMYLNGPSGCGENRCSVLELFSGCSLLSTLCKRRGMNVMSIDNDMNSNATMKADFSSNYIQSILSSQTFEYIHASPVCSTYSLLAGGKHRNTHNYNRTPQSHEADGMLTMLYFVVAKALKMDRSTTVTIENPRGWMRKGNIMKELFEGELGFKRFEINYCQFGRGDKKPTNIWTNDEKLGNILETIGGKCNCPLPHEESIRRNGSSSRDKNFAALPLKLCQIISTYVHSKHTQLKFEKNASHGSSRARGY